VAVAVAVEEQREQEEAKRARAVAVAVEEHRVGPCGFAQRYGLAHSLFVRLEGMEVLVVLLSEDTSPLEVLVEVQGVQGARLSWCMP